MDGRSYMTKGYSTYNDAPNYEGGYGYGPQQAANYYVVETTTIERRHGPAPSYTTFGGVPSRNEPFKEYMPKYAPKDHYEDYEHNYGSDHEDSSPHGYHKRENLMDTFLNKVQIGASRPTKISNYSSPSKYQPVSPPHSYPSEEGHKIKTQNLLGPNKYQSTSPTRSYPSEEGHKIKTQNLLGPNKYQSTSPTRSYPSEEGHKIKTQSLSEPNKYRPTSPTNKHPSEEGHKNKIKDLFNPNKYRTTSPTRSYPSEEAHKIRTQNPSSPNKYRPTSPTRSYPSEEGHKIKTQNLSSPEKYRPISPTRSYPAEGSHKISTQKVSDPNKYRSASPTHNYPYEQAHGIKTQDWNDSNDHQPTRLVHKYPAKQGNLIKTSSGPNKHYPTSPISEGRRYVRTESFPGPNNHWQSVGPPMTHHPLTTPTHDINEALSFLTQAANYSPRSGPMRVGGFNNFGLREQPIEPERRYAKPGFVGATTQAYFGSNTIDSHEAMRKYNGALVP